MPAAKYLLDSEKRDLALALSRALAADPSPHTAPERIAATNSTMVGDYSGAISYLRCRPYAAPGGPEPHADVLAWWDLAHGHACRLEDYANDQDA